jgi:hypothetical protein
MTFIVAFTNILFVKTPGQEFFQYRQMRMSAHSSKNQKILQWLIIIASQLLLQIWTLSLWLFSRGTKFKRAFLSHLSIEEVIDKGLKFFVHKQEELLGV